MVSYTDDQGADNCASYVYDVAGRRVQMTVGTGQGATPVVTRITRDWGAVVLLCSDGLTKHVPEEQIDARIREMTNARQLAEQLVQDAIDDGGSDNITVIVGRTCRGPCI